MQLNTTGLKNIKIFAFFGSDLEGMGINYLRNLTKKGYLLLALDMQAIAEASDTDVPFTMIYDWINPATMAEIDEVSRTCYRDWFLFNKQDFEIDGICWPDFDRHAMYWFWQDVILAKYLADEFKKKKVDHLCFIRRVPPRPHSFYFSSDVCKSFWERELGEKASAIKFSAQVTSNNKPKSLYRNVWKFISKEVHKYKVNACYVKDSIRTEPFRKTKDNVFLVINPGEVYRFSPLLRSLKHNFKGELILLLLSSDPGLGKRISKEFSIPVLCYRCFDQGSPQYKEIFRKGYIEALNNSSDKYWHKPLDYLDYHFEFYCTNRWPRLLSDLRCWSRYWKIVKPKAVIVSSLYDSESQLPAEAANRENIPSFSIPHGGVQIADDLLASKHILYSYRTQQRTWERSGISPSRLMPIRDLVAQNEYEASKSTSVNNKLGLRILVLTNPIGFSDCLTPMINFYSQLEALTSLDNPPADMEDKVIVNYKTHPNYSDLEIFSLISEKLARKVIQPSIDLSTLLKETEVVVALNYHGTALIHAIKNEKPLIFLWTDELLGNLAASRNADLFLPAGILIRHGEDFWNIIRGFLTFPPKLKEAEILAKNFNNSYLNDINFPDIIEAINRT